MIRTNDGFVMSLITVTEKGRDTMHLCPGPEEALPLMAWMLWPDAEDIQWDGHSVPRSPLADKLREASL